MANGRITQKNDKIVVFGIIGVFFIFRGDLKCVFVLLSGVSRKKI